MEKIMAKSSAGFINRIKRALAKYAFSDEIPKKSTELRASDVDARVLRRLKQLYAQQGEYSTDRKSLYEEYQYLDENLSEATASLNVYADNIVSGSIGGSENYNVVVDAGAANKEAIEAVIEYNEQTSGIKDTIWEIARNLTGYGDEFREVVIAENTNGDYFVDKVKYLSPKTIFADVDERGVFHDHAAPYFQLVDATEKKILFERWRLIHFKIGSDVYGYKRALFNNASRRVARQLLWVDESLVLARMSRAWMRYAFMIDTTGMTPDEAWEHIDNFMERMESSSTAEATSGRLNVRAKPPLPDEDIAIPVSQNSKQDVKTLVGDFNIGNIEDVYYLQNKFFIVTSVPKAYLSLEEGTRSKATLEQIDVQFARQVRRRQRGLVPGLRQFYRLIFILNGIDPDSFKWDIVFPELATTDEMMKWEMNKVKAEIAKILVADIGAVNNQYVYTKILGLSDEEIKLFQSVGLGADTGELLRETAALIRKDPQIRQMIDDLKDIVDYKLTRQQQLADLNRDKEE